MEGQNHIGIYIRNNSATVVCLSTRGHEQKLIGCLSVRNEPNEQAEGVAGGVVKLAELIGKKCQEKFPQYKQWDASVSIDCAMYMQHGVHSEFTEVKQISQTIRFDTEEAIASDISNIALAFRVMSTDAGGSELSVFTLDKKILSDIITALGGIGIDPMAVEPDIVSLSRYALKKIPRESEPKGTLFAVFSDHNGYMAGFSGNQKQTIMRTFLAGSAADRTSLLARELPITTALSKSDEPIKSVAVFDSAEKVNVQQLAEKVRMETVSIDLTADAAVAESLTDCSDKVGFAIAYGCAVGQVERENIVNFRNDFMPYQGKKKRLEKLVKIVCVAAALLLVTAGAYFQARLHQTNKYRQQLQAKLEKEYSAVMMGKKITAKTDALKSLDSTYRRIENIRSGKGGTGEESITSQLTAIMDAINKIAKQTALAIESISITGNEIRIVGDTSSRQNTQIFFEALKKNKFEMGQQRLDTKGGRDIFTVAVIPKR